MKRLWHAIEDGAILAALGLGPLIWGGVDIGIETPAAAESEARRTVALAVIFSLMALGCLARLARRLLERDPDPIARTPADLPAAALLVWMAAAGVASRYRYASLLEWYRVAAVLMLVWLVAQRPAQGRRRAWFAGIVVLAGGITAAMGLREWVAEKMAENPVWRVFGGFYSPTVFAAFLVMAIPLAAALAVRARRGPGRPVWAFAAALMTFALYLTGSRGGLLAFGVVVVALVGLSIATSPRRRLLVAVAVPALLVLLGATMFINPMRERLLPKGKHYEQSDPFRVLTWRATTKMAAAHPVLGSGPGTFQYVFPRYAQAGYTRMAHNNYLQIAAEGGAPALLAFLALLAACGRASLKALRRHANDPDRFLVIAAIAGAAGFLVMSLLDYGWYVGAVALTFGLLLGLLLSASRADEAPHPSHLPPPGRKGRKKRPKAQAEAAQRAGPPRRLPRRNALAFLGAALALVLSALPPGIAAWASLRGMHALQLDALGDTAGAESALREAAALMPLDAGYYQQLGRLTGYPQGVHDLRQATARQPTYALNQILLARLYEVGGRTREAADAYRAAVRLNPHYLAARRRLGDLLLQMGDTDQAKKAYAEIVAIGRGPYGRVQALEERVEPEYAYAHYGLARIAMARSRFGEAMRELEQAQQILDEYDRLTRPLDEKLVEIGELDPQALEALVHLRAAIRYRMAVSAWPAREPDALKRAAELRKQATDLVPEVAEEVAREGLYRPRPPSPGGP